MKLYKNYFATVATFVLFQNDSFLQSFSLSLSFSYVEIEREGEKDEV